MKLKQMIFSVVLFLTCLPLFADNAFTVYLAGDSTMSEKTAQAFPEAGWGTPFALMFDDSVVVENHAMNGRSSKSFIKEGRWTKIKESLKKGDYVFVQFGHNDEFENKGERYSTPDEFKKNLTSFIEDVRKIKAHPVLLSSITRLNFDDFGKIKLTHPHAPYCREVAQETGVYFIDLDLITREHFQGMGEVNSVLRFMHLKPGLLPHFPNGVRDSTHLNQLGAREVAQLVVKHLRDNDHPLVKHFRKPTEKQANKKY